MKAWIKSELLRTAKSQNVTIFMKFTLAGADLTNNIGVCLYIGRILLMITVNITKPIRSQPRIQIIPA